MTMQSDSGLSIAPSSREVDQQSVRADASAQRGQRARDSRALPLNARYCARTRA